MRKEVFSADLTIAFTLVTVLSVPCSFGGWSVQIQRLEEGEFSVPMSVEYYLATCCRLFRQQSRFRVTSLAPKEEKGCKFEERVHMSWYDRCTVVIGCFLANHGARKSDPVNNFE